MKQEKEQAKIKMNSKTKKIAIGAVTASTIVAGGAIIGVEIEAKKSDSNRVSLLASEAKTNTVQQRNADTRDATLDSSYTNIKNTLASFTSSALSPLNIVSPNDMSAQKLIEYLNTHGAAADIAKFDLTLVGGGVTTTATGTTLVSGTATSGYVRYNLSVKSDGTSYATNENLGGVGSPANLTFSKSNNKKALDNATLSITAGTTITNNPYQSTTATTTSNYSLSGLSGATISSISVVDAAKALEDSKGNGNYSVPMNFTISYSGATRVVNQTINFTKVNKQIAIDALNAAINSLSLDGDKFTTLVKSSNSQFGVLASDVSSFARVEYSTNGNTWNPLFTSSTASGIQTELTNGIKLPNGSVLSAANVSFRIAQVGNKPTNFVYTLPSSNKNVTTSGLKAVVDISEFLKDVAKAEAATLSGNSRAATLTLKNYSNLVVEVKVANSSTWQTVAQATTALSLINLWNNTTNAFTNTQYDIRVSSTTMNLYNSSDMNTDSISGSVGVSSNGLNFDTSNLTKVVDTTTIAGNVTGNTKTTFALPTITAPGNTTIEFEVLNGTSSLVIGNKTAVENWVKNNNLWNSTTNSWTATSIVARIKPNNNFAVSSNQQATLWQSSTNTLPKYVTTSAKSITLSGLSNGITFAEPTNIPSTTGWSVEYQLVGASLTGWNTKAVVEQWIATNNLWDASSGTNGAWRATSIQKRLTPASGFELSDVQQTEIWNSSSAATIKFVDASSLKTQIQSTVKVTGNDDKHLTWSASDISALATLAAKYNLQIQYALTDNSTVPTTFANDISNLSTLTAWATSGVLPTDKHIWVKISPKTNSYQIDSPSAATFDIASSSGIQSINRYYSMQTTDLDGVTLQTGSTSKSMNFSTPLKNEFDYEFSTDNGTTWKTLTNTQSWISGASNEGIWDSVTQSWRISSIKVRPVAKSGYVLSNQNSKTIWTSGNPGNVSKWIDTAGVISQISTNANLSVDSTHSSLTWTTLDTIVSSLNGRGIKVEFLVSTSAQTSNGLLSSGWSTSIPSLVNEDTTKRYIYARISPNDSSDTITTSGNTNYVDLTTPSGIVNVKTLITTDSLTIDSGILAGDSHKLTGSTALNINASSLSTYQKQGIEIQYTLSDWVLDSALPSKLGISSSIPASMSEAQLKALFAGGTGNLWSLSQNNWATLIKARLVAKTGYILSSDKEVSFDYGSLVKYVDTTSLVNQITTNPPTKIIALTTSTHDHLIWQEPTLAQVGYASPISTMKFLVGNYANVAAANAANANAWSVSLPSSIDFTHDNRHIWVKFEAVAGFSLSNSGPIDLTNSSNIVSVISKVDTQTSYTNINLGSIQATGTTNAAILNETLAGTLPTGSVIKYRTITTSSPATYSAWMNKDAFITFLISNASQIKSIEAHLEVSDATKYVIVNDKLQKIDVSNFFSYTNISTELSSMNTTNIKVLGVLGQTNAIQVILPSVLRPSALLARGLMLQTSVNGAAFTNFVASSSAQAADASLGFEAAAAGSYNIMTIADIGASSSLKFRIIPWTNDEGVNTTISNVNDWQAIVNNIKSKTSDIVTNGAPTEMNWNVAALPKLVQTRKDKLLELLLSGSTKNLVISGLTQSNIASELDGINSVAGYASYIEAGLQLSDGSIGSNYFFKKDDFITWLSGQATTSMKVFNATTNAMENIPAANVRPNWNRIDLDSIKARWISTNTGFRVSDPATVSLISHSGNNYNVQKWVDLTSYLASLAALNISGDTANLSSTSFNAIKNQLISDFGAGAFNILTTSVLGDFTTPTTDSLPSEINFNYELSFKIQPSSSRHDLIASTLSTPASTNPSVNWDKNTSTNILKFIHVDASALSGIVFTGNTRNFSYTIASDLLQCNNNGVLASNGSVTGVEVQARVNSVVGLTSWRSIAQLKIDAAALGISLFDGTWGRDQIDVRYAPLSGYTVDSAETIATKPDVSAMKRFIDLTSLIQTTTTTIAIVSKNKTEAWWNETTSKYDDLKSWGGYVDNQDFDISNIAVNSNLHVQIEYSLDNTNWSTNKPTQFNNIASQRNLYIRYVATSAEYLPGETAVLSDTSSHDVTSVSNIRNVLTKISVTGVNLSNISFSGNTRNFTENLSQANLPQNSHVEYSITNFESPKATDSTISSRAIAELAKIGILPTGPTKVIFDSYNPSMTWNELQLFIQQISPVSQIKEILRNSIKVRLVAENGYSITQPDDSSLRANVNVDALYTLKDITEAINLLNLASTPGSQDGINLYGIKQDPNGILVQIPQALVDFLSANGLKLQYSTDGKANGATSGPLVTIGDNPSWSDVSLSNFAAGIVPGAPSVSHGFRTTLNPVVGKEAFIGFRIVPTQNDLGVLSNAQANSPLSDHYDATMTKLFSSTGDFPHKQYAEQQNFYYVDTTKVPTVIRVDKIDLSTISATGDTRFTDIHEAVKSQIDDENTDKNLDENLQLVYAIDMKDGSFINGNKNDQNALWLTEIDFEAYLSGKLILQNGKVVNKDNPSQIVEAFDASVIAARNLKNGDAVLPKYLDINTVDASATNSLFVKWVSMSSDYMPLSDFIPSKLEPVALSYSPTTFKKWFDGNRFNSLIPLLVVDGSTNSYTIDYTAAPELTDAALAVYGLKMQYSFDGVIWQDQKLDFNGQSWDILAARVMHMRVVPNSYNGTAAITSSVEVDGIKVDYQFATDQKADALANTTKTTGSERSFKTYLDINSSELANISISGNSFELDANALAELAIDNNQEKYSAVEIQYLYDGVWYNKSALLAKMLQIRNSITDASKAAALSLPSDFTHATVQARWHVLDSNNYVIKNEQALVTSGQNANEHVSASNEVTKTAFKTFINIWDVQDKITNDFRTSIGTQEQIITLQSVSGNVFTLDAFLDEARLPLKWFTDHGVKLQYSVAKTPSSELTSNEWSDWTGTYPQIIDGVTFAVTGNPPLWFRIIPVDTATTVVSTTSQNGLGTSINAISIDTSKVTYQIDTQSSALLSLPITGDTQSLLATDESAFTIAKDDGTGAFGVDGLTEYVTDASGAKIDKPTKQQTEDWLRMMGARLNYRVTATRTKGVYVAGRVYEFATFAELKAAIQTTDLNFDRSTLEVRWDFSNVKFSPKDDAWVHPTSADNIVNVIYTEDVYSLTATALKVSGNNLKLQAPIATDEIDKYLSGIKASDRLSASVLLALGLKLQYNWTSLNGQPDSNHWSDVAPDGSTGNSLNGNKDYWIRYAPIDTNYKLASNRWSSDASQTIRINVEQIKLAIPFAYTSTQLMLDAFNAAEVEGTTYDFKWTVGKELPSINQAADNGVHGHMQYSRDGIRWSDTLADALSDTDHYNMNLLSFDKDRGDKLNVRYVYEETIGNVIPTDSNKWVYTDNLGNELTLTQLVRQISIDNLVQPIMTSQTLQELTGQTSILVPGLLNPIGGTNFAQISWNQLANYGLFKPKFIPGNNDQVADFAHMWYDGVIGNQAPYIFNMGQNPFNATDIEAKDILRALTPRHSHFEYRWSSGSMGTWSAWTNTAPMNIFKNSNYDGFEVRLVADSGYELSQNGGAFLIPSTFVDGSSRTAQSIPSQDWSKRYSVVVELLTKDIHLPTIASQQATFIGWNEGPNGLKPTGTFFTDGANGDHHPSNDANMLKNIVISLLNSTGQELDFLKADRGYVLEYNISNSGREIEWTDSRGHVATGWHSSVEGNMDLAPSSSIPWYGAYPTGLKNGDVINVRLRARDGFVISNDDASTDYNATTKTSRWSHIMSLDPISTLTNRIIVPSDFALYDSIHQTDFAGAQIAQNPLMPRIAFSGNEQSGGISIQGGPINPHYHYEVAVLHPTWDKVYVVGETDDNQKPNVGYSIETVEWQKQNPGKSTNVYSTTSGWMSGWKDKVTWQEPLSIGDLSVGDAIVIRLVTDNGWGFEWEDKKLSYNDIDYPKANTYDVFGTNMGLITSSMKLDTNEGVAPIPVRGLTVRPRYDLSELGLVFSTNPAEKLNNGQSKIFLNHFPGEKDSNGAAQGISDRYRWGVSITHNGITSSVSMLNTNGQFDGLVNGDIINIIAVPINSSFILDPGYVNTMVSFTISGLADPLIADGIDRPVMEISGYDGRGTIVKIANKNGQPGSQWSNGDATYPLGRPILPQEIQSGPSLAIWQYQVVHEDPRGYSDSRMDALPWVNEIPKDLKYGDFVRMRVGTLDSSQVALEGGKNWVYSIDPTSTETDPKKNSWFEVKNLNLDPAKIDYQLEILGYIQKTKAQFTSTIDSEDSSHVDREFMVLAKDGTPKTGWVKIDDPIIQKMDNGETLIMRVVAKEGFTFNVTDDNAAMGVHVTTESRTRTINGQQTPYTAYILQKDSWKVVANGLKIFVNTENVHIFIDKTYIINMDGRPLINGIPLDGNATIKEAQVTGRQTIVDVNNSPTAPDGSHYENLIQVRYSVRSIDPFTGQQLPEQILPAGQFPKELSNGDIVTVELVSTNPDYQISNPQRISVTISGLITVVDEDITDPFLTFSGESGKGSVSISPQAPKRTKWVTAVVHELQPGQTLPVINEDISSTSGHPIDPDAAWITAHPGVYYWTSTPPTNLVNGDYVIAMLVSSIPGSGGLKVNNITPGRQGQTPMNVNWIQVSGLAQKLDLSKYQFNLIDEKNPWSPNKDNGYGTDNPTTQNVDESLQDKHTFWNLNYAFAFEGHQEGQAGLVLNAPLESLDLSKLLVDKSGNPIPASIASVVQFAFAVDNDSSSAGNHAWSTTIPKALFNGQYVHVKLVAKTGQTNIDVFGYRPQVFQVKGLDAQASISNKIATLVGAILGGVAALGAAVGTLMFLRKRKKKLHFSDKF